MDEQKLEIIAIPKELFPDFVKVIRAGLEYVDSGHYLPQISDEALEQLEKWCSEEEKYLNQIGVEE